MKLEIKNIEVRNIKKEVIELPEQAINQIAQEIGNAVYNDARDIELRRISESIYDNESVDVTKEQAVYIKSVVISSQAINLSGNIIFSVGEYLDTIINETED